MSVITVRDNESNWWKRKVFVKSVCEMYLHLANTFYNKNVTNICPRQLLWFI